MLLFQGTQSVCKSFIFSLMPSLRHSQEADHFITIKKREISRDASTGKGNWSWIWCKILLLPFPKPPSLQPLPLWQNRDLLKGKLGYSFPLFELQLSAWATCLTNLLLLHSLHSGGCIEPAAKSRVHVRAKEASRNGRQWDQEGREASWEGGSQVRISSDQGQGSLVRLVWTLLEPPAVGNFAILKTDFQPSGAEGERQQQMTRVWPWTQQWRCVPSLFLKHPMEESGRSVRSSFL